MLTEDQLNQARQIVGNEYVIVPVKFYNDNMDELHTLRQQNKQLKNALYGTVDDLISMKKFAHAAILENLLKSIQGGESN